MSNLKRLVMALRLYADDHNDTLSAADDWEVAAVQTLGRKREDPPSHILVCPSDAIRAQEHEAPPEHSYALNRNLGARALASVEQPEATVLLFESNLHRPNSNGTMAAVAAPPRHERSSTAGCAAPIQGNNYAFADGHVKWSVAPPSFGQLPPSGAKPSRPLGRKTQR